ncbi:MAG: hypothetical protein ABN478_07600, partial [Mixta sp.]
KKLLGMIANIESADPTQVQAMLEVVSSSSSVENTAGKRRRTRLSARRPAYWSVILFIRAPSR